MPQLAIGNVALSSSTTPDGNTAVGSQALENNTTGEDNTAIGNLALASNTTGSLNTAIGENELSENTTGNGNIAAGREALANNTSGFSNVALGPLAGSSVTTANNVICIGTAGANLSGSCFIGNIFGATSGGGTAVFINSDGQLGTTTSSGRFKVKIRPMEQASDALFALKPVTFRYKRDIDSQQISQFGLVAEDVEKVNPDLVVRDKEGKPYSVRYDQVNAMLLNEFLKAHRKIQELEANNAQQQKQIDALTVAAQKVSEQLELNKSTLQTVLNNP